jgi:Protein of unknown function, DUF547
MMRAMRRVLCWITAAALGFAAPPAAAAFDQQHTAWDRLLKKHVVWIENGTASRVDYAGFQKDRAQFKPYLDALSAVSQSEFDGWSRPQRLAFLINAYNAYTVELILTEYPKHRSIRDYGALLRSPWKKRFFILLGAQRSLDDIEHGLIRAPGTYEEPRVHMALVCASIGCPALRNEAFVADRLDAQLDDGVVRFLADRSRNRYNSKDGVLEVSSIFDWYGKDFSGRYGSVQQFLARYPDQLADRPADRERIRRAQAPLRYLDYDWDLNDTATPVS